MSGISVSALNLLHDHCDIFDEHPIEELAITLFEPVEILNDALEALPTERIRCFQLENYAVETAGFNIHLFPGLRSLSLHGCQLPPGNLLAQLNDLQTLELDEVSVDFDTLGSGLVDLRITGGSVSRVESVSRLSNLQKLSLEDIEGIELNLTDLSRCASLEVLRLSNVTFDGLQQICQLPIRELFIRHMDYACYCDYDLDAIAKMASLRKLTIESFVRLCPYEVLANALQLNELAIVKEDICESTYELLVRKLNACTIELIGDTDQFASEAN